MNPRIAVIGVGHLGKIHARLLSESSHAELVAVVDPIEPARDEVAAMHGVESHANYQSLIGKIDAAIVATPTDHHEHVGLGLIENGVHVLIEKPIASSTHEANRLIRAAQAFGVTLQVGHVEQFNRAWVLGKRRVRSPHYIGARRCGVFSFRSTDISVVHDLMIHDIELALSVARSPIERVLATGRSIVTNEIDFATVWLHFANGCVGQLTASRVHHDAERKFHIADANGQVIIDLANQEFVYGQTPASDLDLELGRGNGRSTVEFETVEVEASNAIEDEHLDFVECIRQNQGPIVTGERARDALGVAEEIVATIRQAGAVNIRRAA